MPLPQNYNPKEFEEQIYQKWQDNSVGNVEKQLSVQGLKEGSPTHSILMPPPNLTGNLHAGHAFQHYIMDTLSRINRQNGKLNLWFPGVDHAGIQLEGVVDKLIKKGEFDEEIKTKCEKLNLKDKIVEEILELIETKNRVDLAKIIKQNYPEIWTELAWSKVNLWRNNQQNQAKVLGDTPDYSRSLFTLDDKANKMVNYAFNKYWEDGLIYKGAYLVNWSVGLQTAVSDMAGEIEYTTRKDPFVTCDYSVLEIKINNPKFKTPHFQTFLHNFLLPLNLWPRLQLSTVRPETKFTDVAVAMHPSKLDSYYNLNLFSFDKPGFDERLAKEFISEISNYGVEIFYNLPSLHTGVLKLIFSDKVDPNFGTGVLKITPVHDQFDYDLYQEYVNKDILEGSKAVAAIGRDGKLTEVCGEFAGLTVEQGRLAVIKRLAETGYIPVKEEFENESDQVLAEIKNNLKSESFDPTDFSYEEGIKRLKEILGETGQKLQIDWDYEHNVTVCERSKTVIEPLISEEFFLDYTKSIQQNNQITTLQKLGLEGVDEVEYFSSDYKNRAINFVENIKNWCISRDLTWGHRFPVWYNLEINPEKKFFSYQEIKKLIEIENKYVIPMKIQVEKPKEPGDWVQEEKILDTWFSSCLWPLSTLGFVENNTDFTRFYPTSEMITGGDIFYIWVVRMIILGKYFTGQIPFKKVIINPTVLDEKGRKMSKSLGNGLDPVVAIDKFSSDSLRLGMLSGMIPGRNMKMGGKIADNLMEKYRNFGNKLWNVARFLESQEN